MTGPESPVFTGPQTEKAILGEIPGLTSSEVASAAGVTLEQARRLWRALGFPDAGEEAAFTAADLDALNTVVSSVAVGAIDLDTAVRLTRALGQTMARLADWQVATLTARLEQLERGEEPTGSRMGSALRLAEQVGPSYEKPCVKPPGSGPRGRVGVRGVGRGRRRGLLASSAR